MTTQAQAAETDEPVVLRGADATLPAPTLSWRPGSGHDLRFARELAWTRLMLADDLPYTLDTTGEVARPPSLLADVDLRDGLWTMTPRALTSAASLASALMTQGLSVWEVWRSGKVRQRHAIRAYYRSRGLKLVWRIEF